MPLVFPFTNGRFRNFGFSYSVFSSFLNYNRAQFNSQFDCFTWNGARRAEWGEGNVW